ncbi:MAG: secretin N-terminal domain-containing protein, partial [Gammaproteobacteria bacterium]|nr:secretin N-terminal domain-containing protein [Gammaproteobacteria bacterium]
MINPYIKIIFYVTALLLLNGCATTSSKWQDDTDKKIAAELEKTRQTSSLNNKEVSNSLSSALMPPLVMDMPQGNISSPVEKFNVSVNKGKAQDVYLNLVKGTKYSVVLDPSISGNISLKLKNVTLDDVFKYIENAYGFHYEKSDSHYIVYGKKITTRIFHVDYLSMERGGSSGTSASSGGLLEGGNSGVKIETKSKINFWDSLKLQLEAIIGIEDGRGVTLNSQSGIIIARALPGELRQIEN